MAEQHDPFQWAKDYFEISSQRAAQEQRSGDQKLLSVFEAEAKRQQPWSDYPVDTALQNQRTQAAYGLADYKFGLDQQKDQYKSFSKAVNTPPKQLYAMIKDTDKTFGLGDPAYGMALVDKESSWNPGAESPTHAKGIVQFLDSTAAEYGVRNPYDPLDSLKGEARYRQNSARQLQAHNIPPSPAALYLAHQQGWAGAVRLLRNPNAPAVSVVGEEAIRVNGGNRNMTAGQFANMVTNDFMGRYNNYKKQLEAEKKTNNTLVTVEALNSIMADQGYGKDPDQTEPQNQPADTDAADLINPAPGGVRRYQ